jgi:hypothetical protein
MKYSQGVCGARMGFSMRRHVIFFGVLLLFVLQMGPSILDTEAARGIGGVRVTDRQGNSFELYKDYYALVVGVSDYAHWPKLRNAANDARQVASGLKELGFEVKLVLDPSYAEMRSALRDLAYTMGIEQQRGLLFYFAGHGETLELADGTQLGFIIPRDCPLKSNDALGFDSKAISMNEIESTALKVKSKHLLMVFDSCFSGSLFYVDRSPPADITEKSARPVRQFITAGEAEEQVPDQSVFKVVFLQGIKGEADLNADGYVTGSELGMHLETMVVRYSKGDQHPKYGKINNPKLDKGDFVFVPAAKTAALPAPVPQPPVVMPVPSPAPQPPPISPAAIPTIAGKWDRYLSPEAVAGSFPPALPTDSTGFAKTTELEVVQTGETFRVLSAYHLTLRRTDTLDPPWEGKIHAAGVTLTAEDRQRGTTKTDQGVITQMNPGNSIARIDWGKSKSYWIRSGTFAEQTAAVPPQTEPPTTGSPLSLSGIPNIAGKWKLYKEKKNKIGPISFSSWEIKDSEFEVVQKEDGFLYSNINGRKYKLAYDAGKKEFTLYEYIEKFGTWQKEAFWWGTISDTGPDNTVTRMKWWWGLRLGNVTQYLWLRPGLEPDDKKASSKSKEQTSKSSEGSSTGER